MAHYLAGIASKSPFYSCIYNCISMIYNAFVNDLLVIYEHLYKPFIKGTLM